MISRAVDDGAPLEAELTIAGKAAYAMLKQRLMAAKAWAEECAQALKRSSELEALRRLAEQAKHVERTVALPAAPRAALVERLHAAVAWVERAASLVAAAQPPSLQPPSLQPPSLQPPLPPPPSVHLPSSSVAEARALVSEAKPLLKVREVEQAKTILSAALAKLDEWYDECAALFLKPGCATPLTTLLQASAGLVHARPVPAPAGCPHAGDSQMAPPSAGLASSAGHVSEQRQPAVNEPSIELSSQDRPSVELLSEGWPPTDEENELCCPCCTPERPDVPTQVTWVGCDGCDAWYHSYCVRVPDALVETLEHFSCPRCCQLEGKPYTFSPTVPPPILRTMRPSYAAAAELLERADACAVSLPVLEAIRALLLEARRWRERVSTSSALDAADLSTEALVRLINEAAPLEVTMPELSALRLHATRRGVA